MEARGGAGHGADPSLNPLHMATLPVSSSIGAHPNPGFGLISRERSTILAAGRE